MNFIITVALTFIVVMLALLVFRYVGLPIYRVEAINVQRLLESVLAAQRYINILDGIDKYKNHF